METRSRVLLLRHALLLVACSVGLSACTSLRTLWGESSRPVPEAAPPAPPVAAPSGAAGGHRHSADSFGFTAAAVAFLRSGIPRV